MFLGTKCYSENIHWLIKREAQSATYHSHSSLSTENDLINLIMPNKPSGQQSFLSGGERMRLLTQAEEYRWDFWSVSLTLDRYPQVQIYLNQFWTMTTQAEAVDILYFLSPSPGITLGTLSSPCFPPSSMYFSCMHNLRRAVTLLPSISLDHSLLSSSSSAEKCWRNYRMLSFPGWTTVVGLPHIHPAAMIYIYICDSFLFTSSYSLCSCGGCF